MRTRVSTRIIVPGVFALLFCASGAAHAHFNLLMPPPISTDMGGGKGPPPCGPLTPASNVVTKVQGGHPLTVSVAETVQHTGFYRIALAINARTELPLDNVVYDAAHKVLPPSGTPSGNSATADYENPPVFPVLADNLWPHQMANTGTLMFTTSVTLPNITCAKCTLQVIEFMAQHLPNVGGGYFYHHCADLQITADPALPDGGTTDAGPPDAGSPAADASGAEVGGGIGGSVGSGGASASGGATGSGGAPNLGSGGAIAVSSGGSGVTASGGSPGSGGSSPASTATGGAQGASSTGGTGTASTSGSSSGCSLAGGALGSSGAVGVLVLMGAALKSRRRRGRK